MDSNVTVAITRKELKVLNFMHEDDLNENKLIPLSKTCRTHFVISRKSDICLLNLIE